MNKWKNIWNKKNFEYDGDIENVEEIFMNMKVADGYDMLGDLTITFNDFKKQFDDMIWCLQNSGKESIDAKSAFEVGCGCGPNLLLLNRTGVLVGGGDYSENLINSAKKYVKSDDLYVCEAKNINVLPKYDIVFSKGCFCYFESEQYVEQVLDLMVEKANFSVGVLDLFDISKKEECLQYRRNQIENYDVKYEGLGKLFMSKEFFEKYAEKKHLGIRFTETNLKGYWNNGFVFNVYLYK